MTTTFSDACTPANGTVVDASKWTASAFNSSGLVTVNPGGGANPKAAYQSTTIELDTTGTNPYSDGVRLVSIMTPQADFEVTGTVAFLSTAEVEGRLFVRADGAWPQNNVPTKGYGFKVIGNGGSGTLQVLRSTGTIGSEDVLQSITFAFTTGTYNYRFRVQGSSISLRVWQGSEPTTWTIGPLTEGTITGTGVLQINVSDGAAATSVSLRWGPITVDDLATVAPPAPPPSAGGTSGGWSLPDSTTVLNVDQTEWDTRDTIWLREAMKGATGWESGCDVTVSSGMQLTVASGRVRINSTTVIVPGGNITVAAADATLHRFTLLYVTTAGALGTIDGTLAAPGANVFPSEPSSTCVIAAVYVPATTTSLSVSHIGDKRVPAAPREVKTVVFQSSGATVVGTGIGRFKAPWPWEVVGIEASSDAAIAVAPLIFDAVRIPSTGNPASAASIYSADGVRPQIAVSAFLSASAAVPDVSGGTLFAALETLRVDVKSLNAGGPGDNACVYLHYRRAG